MSLIMICKEKGCNEKHFAKGYCKSHYAKKNYITVPHFNTKGNRHLHPGELTEELRPLIPIIKNNILNDCIKNPGKYL